MKLFPISLWVQDVESTLISICVGEPGSLRLRGPLSANGTGRVEVLHKGQWGTICDDGWGMNDAWVACRQLGYPDTVRALPRSQVSPGVGYIWLTYVTCKGTEKNITDCSHQGWGNQDCTHDQDAGVECSTTGKITVKCS